MCILGAGASPSPWPTLDYGSVDSRLINLNRDYSWDPNIQSRKEGGS